MSLAYQPEEGNYPMLINVTHNPDKSVTLTFPDDDGLVRSVTGPASAIAKYVWAQLCKFDRIPVRSSFCVFSDTNPWCAIHSEITNTIFEERRNATRKAK